MSFPQMRTGRCKHAEWKAVGERTLEVLVTVGKPSTASENENVWSHELVSVDAWDEELWAAMTAKSASFSGMKP